jgi:hypothetical protein
MPSPDIEALKAQIKHGSWPSPDDAGALIDELERLIEQRRQQEISIAQVVVFANELGWDGANNSKILATFLRDAFAKAKTLGAVEELERIAGNHHYCSDNDLWRRAAELRKQVTK